MKMKREKLRNLYDSVMGMAIRVHARWIEIKEDEKAMEVIQVVMLIAVGVIAIAAIWLGVNGLLKKWWDLILEHSDSPGGPPIATP